MLPRKPLWVPRKAPFAITRREFLYLTGAAALVAACGNGTDGDYHSGAGSTTSVAAVGEGPEMSFVEPREQLSGELKILLWSHFVPAHDTWFDPFVQEWGEQVGVDVTVDHIAVADVPAAIAVRDPIGPARARSACSTSPSSASTSRPSST